MQAEAALSRLKKAVGEITPYRPFTVGQVMKIKDGEHTLEHFPKRPGPATEAMMKDAKNFLDFHYKNVVLHGLRFGKGMKVVTVPRYSKGILLTWTEGLIGVAITEHNSDNHIHLKALLNKELDKVCHLFIYGYILLESEDNIPVKITRRQDPQASEPMETEPDQQTLDAAGSSGGLGLGDGPKAEKRKGPDSRAVIIAPEKKKQRVGLISQEQLHRRSLWWMMQRSRKVLMEAHNIWYENEVMWTQETKPQPTSTTRSERYLLHCYCRTRAQLHIRLMFCGLCAAVHSLWKGIKNLRDVLENQADNVVRPLVHRMLVADHAMSSLEQLQCHARAMDEDINTLFRAVRRGAPPHPDEPSSSRQRTALGDGRTPNREPEGHPPGSASTGRQPEEEAYLETDFLERASRSRDGDTPRDSELDEDTYDPEVLQERTRDRAALRHNLLIENNNLQIYLVRRMMDFPNLDWRVVGFS